MPMLSFDHPIRMSHLLFTIFLWFALVSTDAQAQLLPGVTFDSRQFRIEQIGDDHLRLIGEVEIDGEGYQFFADQVDLFPSEARLVAIGNVVYVGDGGRVAAERAEFDTEDLTATFYNASGSVNIAEEEIDRSMFGAHEPDMLFYGETIEKLGPRIYRLTKGGFTSCIQPTPRWQMTSNTLTLNLERHVRLTNSILEVKGVPVFYLPVMYYPIPDDDRATGFLMPMYGASTFRGNSLSNAFFWAAGRSHDATFYHDWFTKTGQGTGAEYRYTLGQGNGNLRTYFLDERETTETIGGVERDFPARRSYELRGNARHQIGPNLTARAQIDYFSDVTVQQQYQTNIFEASRSDRNMSANIAGAWGLYQLSGTFDYNETFFGDRESALWGGGPRITFDQSAREVPFTPFYFSLNSEYVKLLRSSTITLNPHSIAGGELEEITIDSGLNRFDVNPVLQIPFTRWPFLTINSSVAWRGTYWTESLSNDVRPTVQVEEGIGRSFLEVQSLITGPSFVKVWDTPDSGYAERMKHVIEPWISLQRVTIVDDFDRIVQIEGTDAILGGSTQVSYGINNRIYAKQSEGGQPGIAREILNVAVMQSYYTDARAAEFDRRFRTSFNRTPPSHYSPVSVLVRAEPTRTLSASMRTEYDARYRALRTISAEGTVGLGDWIQTSVGWSQRRFIEGLSGFNDRNGLDHYLNSVTSMRTKNNTVGGAYSFYYDVLRDHYLQQRVIVYYNAQCCGISGEFQSFDFVGLGSRARVPKDNRFNLSFTLAGLGTFANVLGAFGLGQGQR
jgi:lipopolysaccharide assembly outer membrane protein LptD (OstA)